MQVVAGVILQPGVIHPNDLRVPLEPARDFQRIVAMLLHAQGERFDSGEHEEGVHRRERGPEIAQAQHAAGGSEGKIAERLPQPDAVIGRAGLR